jgi:hypothetical protein
MHTAQWHRQLLQEIMKLVQHFESFATAVTRGITQIALLVLGSTSSNQKGMDHGGKSVHNLSQIFEALNRS